jgi:N utilization substance protein A
VLKRAVETKQFGRIAAQAAKQVIIQGIREAERGINLRRVHLPGARDPYRVVSRIRPAHRGRPPSRSAPTPSTPRPCCLPASNPHEQLTEGTG